MGSTWSFTASIAANTYSKDAIMESQTTREDYVRLEREQVLGNQLTGYYQSLEKNSLVVNSAEASFMLVAHSSIINIMGIKQCESYAKHKSFTTTDLIIMRSLHKLAHFAHDTHSEVKHIIKPLKKAFQEGKLNEVDKTIRYMKYIQVYKGCSFTSIDYQLLDILEYITELCLKKHNSNNTSSNKDPSNACFHWTNIFDILFRGTNIKISKRKSRFDHKQHHDNTTHNKSTTAETNGDNSNNESKSETIVFQCNSQNTYSQPNTIELSTCNISVRDINDTVEQNDDKEAIMESQSILTSKSIFDCLVNEYDHDNNVDNVNFFPIGVQLAGYYGYLYSIRSYRGAYIASKVCDDTLFIPLTIDEYQTFLFEGHVLEMLCNLKRHYVGIAKIARHFSATKNGL